MVWSRDTDSGSQSALCLWPRSPELDSSLVSSASEQITLTLPPALVIDRLLASPPSLRPSLSCQVPAASAADLAGDADTRAPSQAQARVPWGLSWGPSWGPGACISNKSPAMLVPWSRDHTSDSELSTVSPKLSPTTGLPPAPASPARATLTSSEPGPELLRSVPPVVSPSSPSHMLLLSSSS